MIEQWWVWTVTSDDGLTFKVRPHPPPKQVRDMERRVVEVVSFPAKAAAIHEAAKRFAASCMGDGYYALQVGGA